MPQCWRISKVLNEELLPSLSIEELKGLDWPICKETARVWMHRLGFGYGTYVKDIYIDGHDRADVLEYKEGFLVRMDSYQKNSHLFFRCSVEDAQEKYKFSEEDIAAHTVNIQETCVVEIPIDKFDFDRSTFQMGGHTSVATEKPYIIFVQDEAIFKSFDGSKKFWKLKGKQKLRKKGEGKGLMACAFVSEQLGFF